MKKTGTMAFPDWFDLLPKVNNFSPLVFCGPVLPIDEGIKAAAWRLSVIFEFKFFILTPNLIQSKSSN